MEKKQSLTISGNSKNVIKELTVDDRYNIQLSILLLIFSCFFLFLKCYLNISHMYFVDMLHLKNCYCVSQGLSVKAGMGNRGMGGNHGGNAGNRGGNAGNQSGSAGN